MTRLSLWPGWPHPSPLSRLDTRAVQTINNPLENVPQSLDYTLLKSGLRCRLRWLPETGAMNDELTVTQVSGCQCCVSCHRNIQEYLMWEQLSPFPVTGAADHSSHCPRSDSLKYFSSVRSLYLLRLSPSGQWLCQSPTNVCLSSMGTSTLSTLSRQPDKKVKPGTE